MKHFSLALLLAASTFALLAQTGAEAGFFAQAFSYQGDLSNGRYWDFKQTRPGFSFFARFPLSDQWSIRPTLTYASIAGDDIDSPSRAPRGFSFESTLIELVSMAAWEPLGARQPAFSPYLCAGAGILYHDPMPDFSRFTGDPLQFNIVRDRDTQFSRFILAIPLGAGLKYRLSEDWQIGLEGSFRYAFMDYLDGISHSANPEHNDWYASAGIYITRKL
jgi:hypothetical protein